MYSIRSVGFSREGIPDLKSARLLAKDVVDWIVGNKVEILYDGRVIQTVEVVLWAGSPNRKWTPSGQTKPLAMLLATAG